MSYRAYTYLMDTGILVGTTELVQIQDFFGYRLIRYRSTRRYYRTDQIQDLFGYKLFRYRSTRRYYITDQIQDRTCSDTRVIRYRSTRRYYRTYSDTGLSGTGVPVGTTEHIRYRTKIIRYRTDRIQEYQ